MQAGKTSPFFAETAKTSISHSGSEREKDFGAYVVLAAETEAASAIMPSVFAREAPADAAPALYFAPAT
jgi:hypothetical protein